MGGYNFTKPQRKALLWLTPGRICGDAPLAVSAALKSLALYHKDLVTSGYHETPRGRTFLGYTLTDAGASERAAQMELDQ